MYIYIIIRAHTCFPRLTKEKDLDAFALLAVEFAEHPVQTPAALPGLALCIRIMPRRLPRNARQALHPLNRCT